MRRAIVSHIAVLSLLQACDCGGGEERPTATTTRAPSPVTTPAPPRQPVVATGTIEATEGEGEPLEWKHAFDATRLVDATRCGDAIYLVARSGRLVRARMPDLEPDHALAEPAFASTVHGTESELVIGTRDGRLLHTDCDARDLDEARESSFHFSFVHRDPRSKDRVLAAVRKAGEDTTAEIINTLVDVDTGKSTTRPFEFDAPPDSRTVHFVDYRGELWAGVSSASGSKLWYLERFDRNQPRVSGISAPHDLRGLSQIGREVWAYGGNRDTSRGFVFRVDSGNKRVVWDGEKIATGQHAGGDVPSTGPVTLVIQRQTYVFLFTRDAVYRADRELRRWKLVARAGDDVFADVVGWTSDGDDFVVATSEGLFRITTDSISRVFAPSPPRPPDELRLATSLEWKDHTFLATHEGLKAENPATGLAKRVLDVDDETFALVIDGLDRLWAVTAKEVLVIDGSERKPAVTRYSLADLGLDAESIRSFDADDAPDTVRVFAGEEGAFKLTAPVPAI